MTKAIQQNGRIENINGLKFYEQDVLMCSYIYSDDVKINVSIDYRNPGFGIIFAECNGDNISRYSNINLIRIGDLEWSLIKIKNGEQAVINNGSTPLQSSFDEENILNLTISKSGRYIKLYSDQKEILKSSIGDELGKYNIGFYSNSENTIISADVYEKKPQDWITNIENSNGGRVSFKRDTILFENGDGYIESEQQKIKLKAGKYWIDFTAKEVNKNLDIKYYIFESEYDNLEIDPCKKNIVNYDDNSFTLEEDTEVNILFQCSSGEISNISIKDDINQSYVSNSGCEAETKDGSKVIVNLDNIKKITWIGCINNIPTYKINEEAPYYIIKYGDNKYTYSMLSMSLNKEYSFSFLKNDKNKWQLEIKNEGTVFFYEFDTLEKTMEFFYNISGYAKDIIVTTLDGIEINILLQKNYKKYVPIEIESPIIVTDENNSPFDLSSDYRYIETNGKYIFTNWCREYFNGQAKTIFTEKNILDGVDSVILYGIKDDIDIDKIYNISNDKVIHDISTFSKKYDIISSEYYDVTGNSIELAEKITDMKYKYYIVDYLKSDSYCINIAKDNNDNDIYEVDISTSNEKFITLYDMTKDGQIKHYKIIDNISPIDDYFISVKKREDGEDF